MDAISHASEQGNDMAGYTVIDVETTGLSPEHHDRIVEIGVVYVEHDGNIQDHWSTLINPGRDVGPTHIHGIRASDVLKAPTFADVAPYLLRAVTGRTIVAHNASFDLRFIASEMMRAGVPLPSLPLSGVCTMSWSTAYLQAPSRRLVDCCRSCGIPLGHAHSAESDALATARLLGHYLRASSCQPPWLETIHASRSYRWPALPDVYPDMSMCARSSAPPAREDGWLDAVVSRMPRAADARVDSYLDVLEKAMIDGFLAEHEKTALVAVATDAGLTKGQVLDVHCDYLRAMAVVAMADDVLTPEERQQLDAAARVLGLGIADVDAALDYARHGDSASARAAERLQAVGIHLERGDRVVFTGEMGRQRSEWEDIARRAGLQPGSVTKATRVVVAADPNSLSGKAAKARVYGVPIVTEAAFVGILDSYVRRAECPPRSPA